jgi:hypothetical protein
VRKGCVVNGFKGKCRGGGSRLLLFPVPGEGRVWWSRIGVVKVIPGSFRVVAVVDGSSWSGRAAAVVVVCRCRAIKANGGHDQEEEAQGGDAREALVVGFVDVGRPVATAAR